MICNRCNTENSDSAAFCRECGNPLSSAVSLQKDETNSSFSNPYERTSDNQTSNYAPVASSSPYTAQDQSSYQQNSYQQSQYTQPYQQQMTNYPPMPPQDNSHMTVLGWIGRSCISLIPFVGPLIYIIMLFVWAFGDNPKKSLKTWAQAQLIIAGVALVLSFLIVLVTGISLSELADSYYYY